MNKKWLIAAMVFCNGLAISLPALSAWEFNHGQLPLWLRPDAPDVQSMFDDQTVRFLAKRNAPWVVLNAHIHGPSEKYNYAQIANRFRQYDPGVRVLGYTWINVTYTDQHPDRIARVAMQGYENLNPDWIAAYDLAKKEYYGDVANPAFRAWVYDKIVAARNQYALDGFVFDNVNRDPSRYDNAILKARASADPAWAQAYKNGMDALIASLSAVMDVKFNEVYFKEPGVDRAQFDSQLKLFEKSSVGASTESWGGFVDGGRNTFSELLTMMDEWRLRSGGPQRFFIHGKPETKGYFHYAQANRYGRYLYGAYLLGALPNTYYNYIPEYSLPWKPVYGRAHHVLPTEDTLWDLGNAESAYYVDRFGTYQRNWERGKVVVYPHDAIGPGYVDWYVPGANFYRWNGSVVNDQSPLRLYKKQSEIVFKVGYVPASPKGRLITFSETSHPTAQWRNAEILQGGYDKYLRLRAEASDRGEHDLLLFPILQRSFPGGITIRYRTNSTSAKILAVAEVDDASSEDYYAVFEQSSTLAAPREDVQPYYRRFESSGTQIGIPWIPVAPLIADGKWHTVTYSASTLLSQAYPDNRYSYVRYDFMRFEGEIDIDEIKIGSAPYLKDTDLF